MFDLHPQLASDCVILGDFPLCRLLMSRDANYPWFILVPRRKDVREIHQLMPEDRHQLMEESCLLSEVLLDVFTGDKLNVAALGNQVPQLHLHHIVRYISDPAWPRPVWGAVPPLEIGEGMIADRLTRLLPLLKECGLEPVDSAPVLKATS